MHTVLVIDDERVIREGCKRALVEEGYRVLTADNGKEAMELVATEPIDVILCDLKMPVMGALGVLEGVNKNYPDISIIVITGQGTVANAVECMKKGAYEFITKPFRIDHVVMLVKRALAKLPPPSRFQEPERLGG